MKLIAFLLTVTGAIAHAEDINPLILGGTVVPAGTRTYVVGLRTWDTGPAFCGGSLISPTHVLTAGHCAGQATHISVGSHYLSGDRDGERIPIKREIVHPKFNSVSLTYDYSIIELDRPSKFPPVKLYSLDTEKIVGAPAYVMGWGRTSESPGTQSNELLKVMVPVLSDQTCKASVLSAVSETMFCAGGKANQDSCRGDSGGPLIVFTDVGDCLIGVVSWGNACGHAGMPGVYSKVARERAWIQSIAKNITWV